MLTLRQGLNSGQNLKVLHIIKSVADPGCLSRIPDPDFLLIPDLGSRIQKQQQKRGVKKICCIFFCKKKFHKIENYRILFLKCRIKKFGPVSSFQRIVKLFTQKFFTKLSKIWVWDPRIRDPGSRKNLFRIPDLGPGVKKAPDPGSGSATLIINNHMIT